MVVFSKLLDWGVIDTIAPKSTVGAQSENYDNSNGSLGDAVASFFRRITATADQDEERLDDETRTDVSNSEREGGENNLLNIVPDNINLPHGEIETLAPNLEEGDVYVMQEDDDASSNNNTATTDQDGLNGLNDEIADNRDDEIVCYLPADGNLLNPDNLLSPHRGGESVQLVGGIAEQNDVIVIEHLNHNPDEDETHESDLQRLEDEGDDDASMEDATSSNNVGAGEGDDNDAMQEQDSNNNDEIREPEPATVEERITFLSHYTDNIRDSTHEWIIYLDGQNEIRGNDARFLFNENIDLRRRVGQLERLICHVLSPPGVDPENTHIDQLLNSYVNNAPTPYIGRAQVWGE
jgi:hypothetical protein